MITSHGNTETRREIRQAALWLLLLLLCASTLAVTTRAQQVPTRRALESEWPETVKVEGVEIVHVQKNVYMLVGAGATVASACETRLATCALGVRPGPWSAQVVRTRAELSTTSWVAGSMVMGPRGLSQDAPFMASTSLVPSVSPLVYFSAA